MANAVAQREGARDIATQMDAMRPQFQQLLPPEVPVDKFTRVVMMAVQRNPDLLKEDVDRRTLFIACTEAANDGLLPDGKQGALVVFGGKVQWQRMIGGLRVLASRNGFDLRAEVVHKNDKFEYAMGDNPHILHEPPPFGDDRGEMIGGYAIAKHIETGEMWREVMSKAEIEKAKKIARSKGVWDQWESEQWRKTVAKRLFKQLPIELDERMQRAIDRDNEDNFDLPKEPTPAPQQPKPAGSRPAGLQRVIEHGAQPPPAPEAKPGEDDSPI